MANQQRLMVSIKILPSILLIVFILFSPCLSGDFLYWDDHPHLEFALNHSLSLSNVSKIFQSTVNLTYIPLTILTFAIENHYFGPNPFYFHLNNLFCHLAVVAMVFLCGKKMGLTIMAAAIGSLIFGIHPMHVESVAWITSRKDVLYSFFFLLSVYCYLNYTRTWNKATYCWSLFWGFLSILSKPMALSLPLILFLCDWLLKRRWDLSALKDKIPFIVVIVPIAWVTQNLNANNPVWIFPKSFIIWVWTFTFYLEKFFFPAGLSPHYQLPQPIEISNPSYIKALIIFFIFVYLLIRFRNNRWFVFANLYYTGSIFYLTRIEYYQHICFVADRYMYLPSLGYCFLIGIWISTGWEKIKSHSAVGRTIFICIMAGLLFILSVKTYKQSMIWKNDITLWNVVLGKNPMDYIAYNNRGIILLSDGQTALALADFDRAIALKSTYWKAYSNRAGAQRTLGNFDKAIQDYNKAISLQPNSPRISEVHNNRGLIYKKMGNWEAALNDYNRAIILKPDCSECLINRGNLLANLGQLEQALADYNKAISLDSNNALAQRQRAKINSTSPNTPDFSPGMKAKENPTKLKHETK